MEYLSNGDYYENYKPGLSKTTGFNFGISGEPIEFSQFGMGIKGEETVKKRQITSMNGFNFMNIKKKEYNKLGNDYTYINAPIFNYQNLGEKSFLDGFEYNHDDDVIYFYDKISSRPLKFTYNASSSYEDINCKKYVLDSDNIADGINEKDDLESKKAFISQTLNKPFVISVGKNDLDTKIDDEVSEENYICVEEASNMVVDSEINLVYSLYTKNYGYGYYKVENDKTYPIFIYNRNYKVKVDSFNDLFSQVASAKSFRTVFLIVGIIFIVIFAGLAVLCFIKVFIKKKPAISLEESQDNKNVDLINNSNDASQNQNQEQHNE